MIGKQNSGWCLRSLLRPGTQLIKVRQTHVILKPCVLIFLEKLVHGMIHIWNGLKPAKLTRKLIDFKSMNFRKNRNFELPTRPREEIWGLLQEKSNVGPPVAEFRKFLGISCKYS